MIGKFFYPKMQVVNITRENKTMKKGDYIYYFKEKDTFPGIILKVKNDKVKITYNGLEKNFVSWVLIKNITLQKG